LISLGTDISTAGSWAALIAFAGTCLVIELTPGPNMAYLAVLSADKGRRAGFAATVGVALGLLVVGIAAAMGLAAVIDGSRLLYETLRWGGAIYLLFLAWEARQRSEKSANTASTDIDPDLRFFLRGLITNLLNPKAALFYIAVLPTFIDPSQSVARQALTLAAVYVCIASLIHSSIVLLAGSAMPWLENGARSQQVRRVMALLLVVIAVWMLFATRRV
jgi:threonine/homoserine/homoserine lactone efflux protein